MQKKKPEVRDNLDHREGEEQNDNGAHMTTHNKRTSYAAKAEIRM